MISKSSNKFIVRHCPRMITSVRLHDLELVFMLYEISDDLSLLDDSF